MGEDGDFARRFVLDRPMLARIDGRGFTNALDVGCGEGRFCRLLHRRGLTTLGIDPTVALIERARALDPGGAYRVARAEDLEVAPGSFDLVVSYLSLIDIADLERATAAMVRALRPGGSLLVANLTSFNTAGMPEGWTPEADGRKRFAIDRYLEERGVPVSWRGINIINWHRPLSTYMTAFLESGLQLKHFAEPEPTGGDPERVERYRRVPWFHVMEWEKPRS